jgi:hypothetical protein
MSNVGGDYRRRFSEIGCAADRAAAMGYQGGAGTARAAMISSIVASAEPEQIVGRCRTAAMQD